MAFLSFPFCFRERGTDKTNLLLITLLTMQELILEGVPKPRVLCAALTAWLLLLGKALLAVLMLRAQGSCVAPASVLPCRASCCTQGWSSVGKCSSAFHGNFIKPSLIWQLRMRMLPSHCMLRLNTSFQADLLPAPVPYHCNTKKHSIYCWDAHQVHSQHFRSISSALPVTLLRPLSGSE